MGNRWDDVYSKRFGGVWYPNEGVVRFTARHIVRRVGIDAYDAKRRFNRILDVGCGNGRHVLFFAEQGFDAYGIDISAEAIRIADAWLAKRGFKGHLTVGDIESKRLPYEDEYFDLVISAEVLDHIPFFKAKGVMNEIRGVCTKDAYVYVTLRSTEDSEFGRGEKVDMNTYVLQQGYEKGLIQHFFDKAEIRELLEGFKVFDLELYEQRFPDAFTIDKAFLQSSGQVRKNFNLTEHVDMNLKYSRWHIACQKQ